MGKDSDGPDLNSRYSLMMVCGNSVVGKIVDKSGCRPVYFAGAVFAALGMVASSFIDNIYLYFFTYGVFAVLVPCLCPQLPHVANGF